MNELIVIPVEVTQPGQSLVQQAMALTIDGAGSYARAGELLKELKSQLKARLDFFRPIKQKQDEAKRAILDKEKEAVRPLEDTERHLKSLMLAYDREEAAKAEAERRRLQAIADEKARAEKAKADAEAAKQRALVAEARLKAEAARMRAMEADAAERRRLLEQAKRADEKAEKAAAKAEVQVEAAATVLAPVVRVETRLEKVQGISTRQIWKGEVSDTEALIRYAVEHNRFDLVMPNQKVIDGLARSLREQAKIPGVKFYFEESKSVRS